MDPLINFCLFIVSIHNYISRHLPTILDICSTCPYDFTLILLHVYYPFDFTAYQRCLLLNYMGSQLHIKNKTVELL